MLSSRARSARIAAASESSDRCCLRATLSLGCCPGNDTAHRLSAATNVAARCFTFMTVLC